MQQQCVSNQWNNWFYEKNACQTNKIIGSVIVEPIIPLVWSTFSLQNQLFHWFGKIPSAEPIIPLVKQKKQKSLKFGTKQSFDNLEKTKKNQYLDYH